MVVVVFIFFGKLKKGLKTFKLPGFDIINFSVNVERKFKIVTHVKSLVNRVLENINPFDN